MRKHKKTNYIFDKIKEHIYTNINLYIVVSIFFLIGIVGGVIFSNNMENSIEEPTESYITEFIKLVKDGYEIDYTDLLKNTLINNIIYAVVIWFMGCTVIGIPIVYVIIAWRGFSLSFCISLILSSVGLGKGIGFCIFSLLLQNIIIIPVFIALGVSGNKLYKSIIKNKNRENIKIEIIRHTLFSLLMICMIIISSLIETYISTNLTQIYIKNLM